MDDSEAAVIEDCPVISGVPNSSPTIRDRYCPSALKPSAVEPLSVAPASSIMFIVNIRERACGPNPDQNFSANSIRFCMR